MNNIRLRDLKISDIDYMREFVEDEDVSKNFVFTRYPYSKEKMISFIKSSWEDKIMYIMQLQMKMIIISALLV